MNNVLPAVKTDAAAVLHTRDVLVYCNWMYLIVEWWREIRVDVQMYKSIVVVQVNTDSPSLVAAIRDKQTENMSLGVRHNSPTVSRKQKLTINF